MVDVMHDTDLGARLRFLRLDAETTRLLPEIWREISPSMPSLLEAFYSHIRTIPELAKLIGNQQARLIDAQIKT